MRQVVLADNAGARVEVAQVKAKLPHDSDPVCSGARSEVLVAFNPAGDHLKGNSLSGFEFVEEEPVEEAERPRSAALTTPRWTGFQEPLEPVCQGTSKETGGHTL